MTAFVIHEPRRFTPCHPERRLLTRAIFWSGVHDEQRHPPPTPTRLWASPPPSQSDVTNDSVDDAPPMTGEERERDKMEQGQIEIV